MAKTEMKNSGVTAGTPGNILLGAGTIHKGLVCTGGQWNFAESLMGATSGGTKVTITPEFTDVEVDGVGVKMKGLTVKTGESATMETNLVEVRPELMAMLVAGDKGAGKYAGYQEIKSRATLAEGDYIENLAYVGKTMAGEPVIILFDWALCTSGLEVEGKNKESAVVKAAFQCYGTLDGDELCLPYHIYYPEA